MLPATVLPIAACAEASIADHSVHRGDTLHSISEEMDDGTTRRSIYRLNKETIKDPDLIRNGLIIHLPAAENSEPVPEETSFTEYRSEQDRATFPLFSLSERRVYPDYMCIEPELTEMLQGVADEADGYLQGLEYRRKKPYSLYGKLYDRPEKPAIKEVKDIVRYTIILPVRGNAD